MAKSRDAFRTISEVSEALDTPAHVLRFWESKFKQIKPVKRAGGRRYYRPDDLALLAAIKNLLHEQGHSIKNAQKLIRESGVKQIVQDGHALLGSVEDTDESDATVAVMPPPTATPVADSQPDLFAGSETPPKPPRIEITSVQAVPDPEPQTDDNIFANEEFVSASLKDIDAAPETKSVAVNLPSPPKAREDMPSRILETLSKSDPQRVKANADKIAPLVARLAALRDEMRHPW